MSRYATFKSLLYFLAIAFLILPGPASASVVYEYIYTGNDTWGEPYPGQDGRGAVFFSLRSPVPLAVGANVQPGADMYQPPIMPTGFEMTASTRHWYGRGLFLDYSLASFPPPAPCVTPDDWDYIVYGPYICPTIRVAYPYVYIGALDANGLPTAWDVSLWFAQYGFMDGGTEQVETHADLNGDPFGMDSAWYGGRSGGGEILYVINNPGQWERRIFEVDAPATLSLIGIALLSLFGLRTWRGVVGYSPTQNATRKLWQVLNN